MDESFQEYLNRMQSSRDELTEVHEIVKAISVWGADERLYRLEAYRHCSDGDDVFDVRYYEMATIPVVPPDDSGNWPTEARAWVQYNGPWVQAESAEDAISSGLGHLAHRIHHATQDD